ncbi:MAG TPA: hypothetical protein VGP93_12405 [Polyangiaceae bacterium]|nr:hypothetical protein [Polyangiaceae bacterium]
MVQMMAGAEEVEVLGDNAVARLELDLKGALRRRPVQEGKLAGALRVLSAHSPRLRRELASAVDTMVRRGSFERPLYAAAVRALAEQHDPRLGPPLCRALASEGSGGLPSLSAASLSNDPGLSDTLAKLAVSRHAHIAFAAEVARVARHESSGAHIASIAPKIKEAHRIALCLELFVPLLWQAPLDSSIAPALAVLRDSERHLGRWLVLAEIAVRAGDQQPLEEARERAQAGPASARAAWALVAWALDPTGGGDTPVRPTVELVSRLSDRPSSDKDTTFLFRLAEAGVSGARHMLENLARGAILPNEPAVRAAMHLAREYRDPRFREQLLETAKSPKREHLRGFAAAALFDLGESEAAAAVAGELGKSRQLAALAWCALVRAGLAGRREGFLVSEANYRRLQLGWVE